MIKLAKRYNLAQNIPEPLAPTLPENNPLPLPIAEIKTSVPLQRQSVSFPRIKIKSLIRQAMHEAAVDHYPIDDLAEKKLADFEKSPHHEAAKELKPSLSKLVTGEIQLDPSQLHAVENLKLHRFGCLTGSAGTGKTTVTKFLVDSVVDDVGTVALHEYWGKKNDEYDQPLAEISFVPSICLCAPTGKASQMIKKNFPHDWKNNIMTIHRMLAYYPEFLSVYDEVSREDKTTINWIPRYTATNKMPWDIIFIDEAGMVPVLLWEQIIAAAKHDCKIYFIGDINQLPPPYGQPIFPFAMSKYPTFELTEIHRQKGENNSIVENAWKVIHGQKPISDDITKPDWKFLTRKLSDDPNMASMQVRALVSQIKGKVYEPLRDIIITPINGEKEDSSGMQLGRMLLNDYFSATFVDNSQRYKIDAGRDVKLFAVSDRVMVTKNDYEKQVTNGMIGVIKSIKVNGIWRGPYGKFGLVETIGDEAPDIDATELLEQDFTADIENMMEGGGKAAKKDIFRGPSSHIVEVEFGTEEEPHVVNFANYSEMISLDLAYVATCHKMQGGQAPLVIVIVHGSHKGLLSRIGREWLYTAITRAEERCIVLYTDLGLRSVLTNQSIKGKNLEEKVARFAQLCKKTEFGQAVKVTLPENEKI